MLLLDEGFCSVGLKSEWSRIRVDTLGSELEYKSESLGVIDSAALVGTAKLLAQ